MIKVNTTLIGKIAGEARSQQTKDGMEVYVLPINVVILAKQGINKTITVETLIPKNLITLSDVCEGNRAEIHGEMTISKRDDQLRFVLSASNCVLAAVSPEDCIKGEMTFRGSVGKLVDQRTTQKGDPYVVFSAFSAEKVGSGTNDFACVWSRFLYFDYTKEDWLQQKSKVLVKGEMILSVYNDNLDISCKVSSLEQYVPTSNKNGSNTGNIQQPETEEQPF